MTGLEIGALACLAFWVGLTLDRSRAWPRESLLPECERSASRRRSGPVCAVIPARDEEKTLARTLGSLLQQDAVDLVVVANDGSEDSTAEVVDRVAEESVRGPALRRIEVPPPPAGWSGKVHALAYSTARILEDEALLGTEDGWWLFGDADIEQDPSTARAMLAIAESREAGGPYDLVSVMARLHTASFWERLLIPPFVFFFQLLYPFRRVRNARSAVAAAAGGCILVRRTAYEQVGGHAAIRDALIDDVALARLIKTNGGRVWLGLDENVRSIRPYRGLSELWRMVSRSAFVQLRYRYDLLALVILGLAVFVVAPPLLIVAGGASAATGAVSVPTGLRIMIWAGAAWLLQVRSLLPSIRHHRVPSPFGFTLPVAGALYGLMTLSSAWSHLFGRGPRWKGRSYPDRQGKPGD